MTDLLSRFTTFISEQKLFDASDHLLLAVSGGVDSVVLCELCSKSGFEFTIAHVNFSLRGAESDRDQQFVEGLATKYQKKILINRFDTQAHAEKNKCSIQVAARSLRYKWFEELTNAEGGPLYILTAHQLDDNVETVLMNFFKGTGIAGLHGILPRHGKLVRPLLFARKGELVAFAEEHLLSWVEDSSNQSDQYARNFMRQHIIPEIRQLYPELIGNISSNIDRFREVEMLYQESILRQKKKLVEFRGPEFHIPVMKLKKARPLNTILYEIIRDFGFGPGQVGELIHLLDSETGKYIQSSSHRILKNRQWLIIAPLQDASSKTILIEENENEFEMGLGKLVLEKLTLAKHGDIKLSASQTIAMLDAAHIHYPMILRHWKQGDYFYPLGMKKKKKVSRFLIDQKLPATEKEKIWVIEVNKKIIWIVGQRIDDRFKITPSTKEILKMEIRTQ
jgi:tRNA(Ile)-lysidine synthase